MPCNYATSSPKIKTYLNETLCLAALTHLTSAQLNTLYDQLDWIPSTTSTASDDEERSNKTKLIAWILRNIPTLKSPTESMRTKALIDGSMKLRAASVDTKKPTPNQAEVVEKTQQSQPLIKTEQVDEMEWTGDSSTTAKETLKSSSESNSKNNHVPSAVADSAQSAKVHAKTRKSKNKATKMIAKAMFEIDESDEDDWGVCSGDDQDLVCPLSSTDKTTEQSNKPTPCDAAVLSDPTGWFSDSGFEEAMVGHGVASAAREADGVFASTPSPTTSDDCSPCAGLVNPNHNTSSNATKTAPAKCITSVNPSTPLVVSCLDDPILAIFGACQQGRFEEALVFNAQVALMIYQMKLRSMVAN